MAHVEIYTKQWCPYCTRAKSLLASKGVSFDEIDISMSADLRAKMIERANNSFTVPQIFIDGVHVGGSDDLVALNSTGELDKRLAGP